VYSSPDESVRSTSVRSKRRGDQRGLGGGVADKEEYSIHTTNIISQRQYFVARCLSSYVSNVFELRSMCVCFPSTRKLVTCAVWSLLLTVLPLTVDAELLWQGNGPVDQVETSPEILLVYRAHLVMIAHKILAASTRRKSVKKIAQSCNVQFKFAQPRTRMTAVCLAVALY
jgi:uncharacterized membrane protein